MNRFETHATVEDQGQVHLAGVPFESGTRVDVTITPVTTGGSDSDRAAALLAALGKARNTESIGPLRRSEIYDRDILR
jgi:hypothetical protein